MPAVKHIADVAFIDGHSLLNELRVSLQELPSIILSLIGDLRLPGMNLPGPMLWVRLERRNLVRIVMSSHTYHFINLVLRILSQLSWILSWTSCAFSNLSRICSNLKTNRSSQEAFHIFSSHSLLRRSMVFLILSP